jgi:hypothetical protein
MMPLLLLAEEGEGAAAATADSSPPAASASSGGSVNLRRACSLSDLNKPNVSRRVLPSPPNNGRKGIASYSSYLPTLLKFSTVPQLKSFLKSRLKSSQVFCMAPPRLYTVHGVYGYIFK